MKKEKCCANCDHWLKEYEKCEHPEQHQCESDYYSAQPENYCDLWQSGKDVSKKYLVLCNRHSSIYGDNWCKFWGAWDSEAGYTSDLRIAHRFDESEISRFDDSSDIPIPIDILGIPEECESEEVYNEKICMLVEKGTLNRLLDLKLGCSN